MKNANGPLVWKILNNSGRYVHPTISIADFFDVVAHPSMQIAKNPGVAAAGNFTLWEQ
jgi:hypothetical protein